MNLRGVEKQLFVEEPIGSLALWNDLRLARKALSQVDLEEVRRSRCTEPEKGLLQILYYTTI